MANGSTEGILTMIFEGQSVGTLFLPQGQPLSAWKRWLGYTARPKGVLTVDAGAVRAIVEHGKSLLPVGVVSVSGVFGKGDVVSIRSQNDLEIARGLINYTSSDSLKIAGQSTEHVARIFNRIPYVEIVHRDNLVILR
jgi:glutamate 5-kinase